MRGTALGPARSRVSPRIALLLPTFAARVFSLVRRAYAALGKSVGPVAFDERAVIEQHMRMMMADFLANAPDAKVTDIWVSVPKCAEDADCQDPRMTCAEGTCAFHEHAVRAAPAPPGPGVSALACVRCRCRRSSRFQPHQTPCPVRRACAVRGHDQLGVPQPRRRLLPSGDQGPHRFPRWFR